MPRPPPLHPRQERNGERGGTGERGPPMCRLRGLRCGHSARRQPPREDDGIAGCSGRGRGLEETSRRRSVSIGNWKIVVYIYFFCAEVDQSGNMELTCR